MNLKLVFRMREGGVVEAVWIRDAKDRSETGRKQEKDGYRQVIDFGESS